MKAMKNVVAAIVIIAMLTMACGAVSVEDFTDIPNGWSQSAIEHAIENGLLMGDNGLIKPQDNLTRAQMAAIVNRAFGTTAKADISAFQDVNSNSWYYSDMAMAVQMGTFVGYDNRLNPNNNITRQEAFLVLARAFKLSDGNDSALDNFKDKAYIAPWAKGAVSAMSKAGYINGAYGKLNPLSNITREEFAQLMDNMLKKYIKSEGTYTSLPSGNIMVNTPNVILKDVTVTGDLIIGDGVGDGDVTLDGVKVTGRTVVRGGGINSIKIIGKSNIENIVIARVDGQVRVYAEDGTTVGQIIIDGNDNVTIEGNVGIVTLMATDITVTATNAQITEASIAGENSKLVIAANTTVNTVLVNAPEIKVEVLGKVTTIETTKEATKADINVSSGAKVESVVVNSEGTNISGSGSVTAVTANANNISVTTPNTSVTAAEGTTGVTTGSKSASGGTSSNSNEGGDSPGGSPGGDGSTYVQRVLINIDGTPYDIMAEDNDKVTNVINTYLDKYKNSTLINSYITKLSDKINIIKVNEVFLADGWTKLQPQLKLEGDIKTAYGYLDPTKITNVTGVINYISNMNLVFSVQENRKVVLDKIKKLTSLTYNGKPLSEVTLTVDSKTYPSVTVSEGANKVADFLETYSNPTIGDLFTACGTNSMINLTIGTNHTIKIEKKIEKAN